MILRCRRHNTAIHCVFYILFIPRNLPRDNTRRMTHCSASLRVQGIAQNTTSSSTTRIIPPFSWLFSSKRVNFISLFTFSHLYATLFPKTNHIGAFPNRKPHYQRGTLTVMSIARLGCVGVDFSKTSVVARMAMSQVTP